MVDAHLLHGLPGAAVEVLLAPQALVQPVSTLFEALVQALRSQDGLPIDRASCSVPTLHPETRSVQLVWTAAGVVAVPRTYADVSSPLFARSPMRPLYEGRTSVIRERIAPGPAGRAYEILDELAADGFTDYLATITQAENRLEMGLSVHLGRVAYGNIGGPRRLDFTVIGAAVNLASRLEGMCRTLGHPMVMSDPARCLTSPAAAC